MNSLRLLVKHVSIAHTRVAPKEVHDAAARWLNSDEARLLGNCAGDARGSIGRSDASSGRSGLVRHMVSAITRATVSDSGGGGDGDQQTEARDGNCAGIRPQLRRNRAKRAGY